MAEIIDADGASVKIYRRLVGNSSPSNAPPGMGDIFKIQRRETTISNVVQGPIKRKDISTTEKAKRQNDKFFPYGAPRAQR